MIEAQGGLCPICKKRPAVHVDHDHKTGKVRAILCEMCNGGLGQFKDNPESIRRAIAYLERSRD
jgi:Recombination endonuclease VII